uniref:Uncharacterized protein n=1 Tax=Myoviridae sp. ctNQV2 TaxID=2827683 RepID=A0A8S5RZ05_9CAUD|nr:MAG TPA: hypothetical protein [Myoviridae sp. ctNQV2]
MFFHNLSPFLFNICKDKKNLFPIQVFCVNNS